MPGNHVGPTSGVSFLYHPWVKSSDPNSRGVPPSNEDEANLIPGAPLVAYGDIPQLKNYDNLPEPLFTTEQISDLSDRYFQYISPTYRFLHHPTLKKWAVSFVTNAIHKLTAAQQACVLFVCAQTLLHATPGAPYVAGKGNINLSMACSERAKTLLEREPGPPSLASVQARIGMCLNLLSTFRLNECRYCFSFAVTVATALGIHRRQSSSKVNPLEAECRKRTFWSLYVLDGYLSVMLGRPRLLRDEDIDQPFPQNIDDHDLISSEPIESLPRHGNLEAAICHAKLAKITARNNDLLYPLHSLSNDQILDRSNEILAVLAEWQNDLPDFLKPREKTLTGQRTFERQNTILKLALAHVRILATRRCLLMDFGEGTSLFSQSDPRAKRSLRECIAAIITILDTVEALIAQGQCYGSFWSTQYIALVGISTLYVLLIQGVRHGGTGTMLNVDECSAKARRCHDHLSTLPPPGSQAARHHALLAHLRSKVEKSLAKRRNTNKASTGSSQRRTTSIDSTSKPGIRHGSEAGNVMSITDLSNNTFTSPRTAEDVTSASAEPFPSLFDQSINNTHDANDYSMFSTMLTPNSNSDSSFQYMLDFGWESLDTIGAGSMNGQDMFGFGMS